MLNTKAIKVNSFIFFHKIKQPNVYQYLYIRQDILHNVKLLHKPHPLFVQVDCFLNKHH